MGVVYWDGDAPAPGKMNEIDGYGMSGVATKMPHSHSTPAGVDGGSRTPPTTPRKAGKMLAFRVQMLDDSITMFQVQVGALLLLFRTELKFGRSYYGQERLDFCR